MIPKIIAFQGYPIDQAIAKYEKELPAIVEQFENENGKCQVLPNIIYNDRLDVFVITIILAVNEVKNKAEEITASGMGLIDQLKNRLTQVFDADGCDHEYESGFDGQGNEKIICKKYGTPLA